MAQEVGRVDLGSSRLAGQRDRCAGPVVEGDPLRTATRRHRAQAMILASRELAQDVIFVDVPITEEGSAETVTVRGSSRALRDPGQ